MRSIRGIISREEVDENREYAGTMYDVLMCAILPLLLVPVCTDSIFVVCCTGYISTGTAPNVGYVNRTFVDYMS